MGDIQALGLASLPRQYVYFNDVGVPWEQKLAQAHDQAQAYLNASIAPGTTLDMAAYAATYEAVSLDVSNRADIWTPTISADQDLDPQAALSMPADQAKTYYLGKYAQANQNLGVYLTGYGRQQIATGGWTQQEFDQGAELRLRAFSDIIYLGKTGALAAIVNAPGYVQQNGYGSGSTITISTPGVTIEGGQASAGLGFEPVSTLIVAAIILAAIAVAAGIGVMVYFASENAKNRQAALEMCNDAIRSGHPDAGTICQGAFDLVGKLADSANTNPMDLLFGPGTMKTVVNGVLVVGAGALLVYFAPQIARSIERTRDAYADEKQRNLRRYVQLQENRRRLRGAW